MDIDVLDVPVFRQDEPTVATLQEIHTGDVVSFEIDILVLRVEERLQQGTRPSDEGLGAFVQELNLGVSVFMEEERDLNLQLMREIIHEIIQVIHVFVVVVLQRLFQPLVEVQGQEELFVDPVQHHHLLLELSVLGIVVLQDRSQGTRSKGEGDDTNDHDNYTEQLFQAVSSRDISIPHCRDGRYSEVERSQVLAPSRISNIIFEPGVRILLI
mmetsp:Transcript_36132/g.55485  ORF Transcript_36132/g.55485 Transcript_36132/m.55485 type:complete len:213 (-) Transcript_36132:351-989(-)